MEPLAAILLLMPLFGPAPSENHHASPEEWQRLKSCARMLEITGDRETWACDRPYKQGYDPASYRSEWLWCKTAWNEVKDCPHLCEADHLPPYEYCHLWCEHLAPQIARLESEELLRLYLGDAIRDELKQLRREHSYWSYAADAANPQQWVKCRRMALAEMQRIERGK